MSNPFEVLEQKLENIETLLLSIKGEKPEQQKRVTYLTRIQAAEMLHITLPTLSFYTKNGLIQGSRIGTRILYTEDAVNEAVKAIPILRRMKR
jgi:hypothetical protein